MALSAPQGGRRAGRRAGAGRAAGRSIATKGQGYCRRAGKGREEAMGFTNYLLPLPPPPAYAPTEVSVRGSANTGTKGGVCGEAMRERQEEHLGADHLRSPCAWNRLRHVLHYGRPIISSPCCAGGASAWSPSPSRPTTPPPASSLRPSSRAWTNFTRKISPRRSRGGCGRPRREASG